MAKDAKLKRVPLPFAWKHFTYVLLVGIGSYRTYEVHRDFRRKGEIVLLSCHGFLTVPNTGIL